MTTTGGRSLGGPPPRARGAELQHRPAPCRGRGARVARRGPHPARGAAGELGRRRFASAWPQRSRPSLRPVLNATGVVLHTNLGRAPLADGGARGDRGRSPRGYSNLEFDLDTGTRGSAAAITAALCSASSPAPRMRSSSTTPRGALLLALERAGRRARGRSISRGELIEIGGSFRIPDIMAQSGARLARGRAPPTAPTSTDYAAALDAGDGARCSRSTARNFEQRGFVATPEPRARGAGAARAGIPYLFDVGSGLLADLDALGAHAASRRVARWPSPPARPRAVQR